MNYFPLTVIDDFFDDPIEVKNFAESVEYDLPSETNYPGVASKKQITDLYPQLSNWIQYKLMNIFYHLNSDIKWDIEMDFQKISPYNFDDQFHILNCGIPHIDDSVVLAGLIYLNENPYPDTGTSFFSKKNVLTDFGCSTGGPSGSPLALSGTLSLIVVLSSNIL